jgi:hypothetical protein
LEGWLTKISELVFGITMNGRWALNRREQWLGLDVDVPDGDNDTGRG